MKGKYNTLKPSTVVCFEYKKNPNKIGVLYHYLVNSNAALWVEMPLRIKKAGGFEIGTDDKAAAVKKPGML